jgi:hypothetical protein
MKRENLIFELTEYELIYLINNENAIVEVAEFFAKGGFNSWTNDQLEKKYNEFIAEEV